MSHNAQEDLTERLIEFLGRYYKEEVGQLADRYPKDQQSIHIDYDDIFQYSPKIADDVLDHPESMVEYFEEAVSLYDLPIDKDLSGATVRLFNLPAANDVDEVSRHDNIGGLLDVRGQVQKISAVKPRVDEAAFECQRCATLSRIPQFGESLQEPHECEGCERQGPFRLNAGQSEWTNHQFARLQQPPEQTQGGEGATVDVHLEADLINEFNAGDRVTLTGLVDVEEPESNQSRDFEVNLDARAVVREESDYEDIDVDEHKEEIKAIANGEYGDPFELLIDSINPRHEGDEDVKLGIGLQLFGGWAHEYPDGSRDRGDSHLLMLGDPGCGKSTFLEWVDKIAPRSTYASGQGASAAGMTAAAVSDDFGDAEWGLEAGALVLADGGVACVDEIDKMQDDAVSSMHDALEGQQVHINKAGINTTLNARSALLAAGNPKHGRFDPYQPRAEQIDLGPTLLSRFDLMFMVSDDPDADTDRNVVSSMTDSRYAGGKYTLGKDLTEEETEAVNPAIPANVLRAYIAYAKENVHPLLRDEDVKQKLVDYFVGFRQNTGSEDNEDNPVPLTFRKVEAIQRIAESSARVRLSNTIEMADVERAIQLVESSMRQVGYDPESGQFDADIVETGQSKSQRERRKEIIAFLQENDGATMAEIEDEIEASSGKLNHDIKALKSNGRIYGSGGGVLRKS